MIASRSATAMTLTLALFAGSWPSPSAQTTAQTAGSSQGEPWAADWPRKFTSDGVKYTAYTPQLDSWDGHDLKARMAIQAAPETKTEDAKTHYGVVWLDARTQVDKDRRVVTLEDVKVTRADFPSDSDRRP